MSAKAEPTAKAVFVDEEVTSVVLAVIRDARKYAVVVTPYLKLSGHAKQAIEQAVQRGAQVNFILRQETDLIKAADDVNWLHQKGVKLLTVANLHAKIYLNEAAIVVSSMNFHSSSMQNSLEFAIRLKDPVEEKQIRSYVLERLKNAAEPLEVWAKRMGIWIEQSATSTAAASGPQQQAVLGVCIRCSQPVPPDPNRPLCDGCYEKWSEWGNEEYEEKFCHACGRPERTSYARPLCRQCYAASAR